MREIQGTILGVEGRATSTGKSMWNIKFSDGGEYGTFNSGLANKANQLVGQQVELRVEDKSTAAGFFTNAVDVGLPGQLPALVLPPGTPVVPVTQGAQVVGEPPPITQTERYAYRMHPDAEARITKLSALETAFGFVGQLLQGAGPETLEEAKELGHTLARELYSASRSHEGADTPAPVATPETVAAEVNAQADAPVVQVGVASSAGPIPW